MVINGPTGSHHGGLIATGPAASDHAFMLQALELARTAFDRGETPVGAVIVRNCVVIGSGHNMVETRTDPTAHAELIALTQACRAAGDWRLPGATVYVTLEPCVMCAAALLHARVARVVYAAPDSRWGGLGSLFDLAHDPRLNHELEVVGRVMEEQSADLLKRFFRNLRKPPT